MNPSREMILNTLKEATGIPSHLPDEKTEGLEERIQASLLSITPHDYSGLRDQFQKELEIVAGEFVIARGEGKLADVVVNFLNQNNAKSLAVSGNGFTADVAERLRERVNGLSVVNASKLDYQTRRDKIAVTDAALVEADYAIADIGAVALFYNQTPSLLPHFLPDCIFTIVKPNQLVANLFELFAKVSVEKLSKMVLVTGPSRTADIEKILILGAHGPRCFAVGMLE